MRHLAVTAACSVLAITSFAHGWGGTGHIAITELALEAAAPEMPEWINNALFHERVAFMCNEPDRRRGLGLTCLDHESNPEHYIDIEQLERDFDISYDALPPLRYDFVLAMGEAMHRQPERFEDDVADDAGIAWMPGFLPYAMHEDYVKLVAAMRSCRLLEQFAHDDPLRANEMKQARAEVAYHMGILSHWTADAAQPLHTTVHHHGWIGDNPNNYTTESRFHSRIDDEVVRVHNLSAEALVGVLAVEPIEVADISNPWNEILSHIERSFELVEPIYVLELDEELDSDKGRAFLLERFRDGAATLSGLYVAAWERSAITDREIANYLRYETPSPHQP